MRYYVTLEGTEHAVDINPRPTGGYEVSLGGKPVVADVVQVGGTLSMIVDGRVVDLTVEGAPPAVGVIASGKRVYLEVESERGRAARAAKSRGAAQGDDIVASPMPGRVLKVLVAIDDEVAVGQSLVVVEAMKMENDLRATRAGKVVEVFVKAGEAVESGAKLVKIG
jgi:biotin carboxyl carrier protein